jgi:hypothetical protein
MLQSVRSVTEMNLDGKAATGVVSSSSLEYARVREGTPPTHATIYCRVACLRWPFLSTYKRCIVLLKCALPVSYYWPVRYLDVITFVTPTLPVRYLDVTLS